VSRSVPDSPTFRKSTASQPGGNCVEVGLGEGAVRIRDSRRPAGVNLTITQAGWQVFLAGTRAGRFDLTGGPGNANRVK
jgi:hypothetical protein